MDIGRGRRLDIPFPIPRKEHAMSKKKNSTGEISFRPYRSYFILSFIILVILVAGWLLYLAAALSGSDILFPIVLLVCNTIVIIPLCFITHQCWVFSSLHIIATSENITIKYPKSKKNIHAQWTDFCVAYAVNTGPRGPLYLILSKKPLSYEDQMLLIRDEMTYPKDDDSICFKTDYYDILKSWIQGKIPLHEKGITA